MAIDIKQSMADPPSIDGGNRDIQGRIVSKTIKLGMFTTNENAVWAGNTQLRKESYPFGFLKIAVNRRAFRHEVGDCFKWNYPPYSISGMICRVLQKQEESLESEKIVIAAQEDVFSTADFIETYEPPVKHSIPRPTYSADPFQNQMVMEAPNVWTPDIEILPLACRESDQDLGFELHMSVDGGSSYFLLDNLSNLRPFGATVGSTYPIDTYPIDNTLGFTVEFDNQNDVSLIATVTWPEVLAAIKNNALIGNDVDGYEIITFQTITPISGLQYKIENIIRGRFDTERKAHPVGDKFWFIGSDIGTIAHQEIVAGATRQFKLVPYNIKAVGDISEATALELMVEGRAKTPYKPANFCANGSRYVARYDDDIVLTWSARYRGKGAGTGIPGQVFPTSDWEGAFSLVVYVDDVAVRFVDVNDLTWTYTEAMNIADNGSLADEVRFVLSNYRAEGGRTYYSEWAEVTCKKN